MSESLFKFSMRYTDRDKDRYYFTNWDNSSTATILAKTRTQAINELKDCLGEPKGYREWAIVVSHIEQVETKED